MVCLFKKLDIDSLAARGSFLLLALFISGCSTLTKQQCRSENWHEYGRVDASRGRPETFLSEHEDACGVEASKAQDYKRGWNEGLKEYCSPNMGFHLGANGYRNPGYCPQSLKVAFDEKYVEGEKVWKLRKNLAELNDHLQKVEENEAKQAQNRSTFEQVMKLMQGPGVVEPQYSSIVRGQRDAVKQEIDRLEKPYPTPQMFKQAMDWESSRPQVGAWVGTFVGFGSGHGIQGRYSKRGWWYTVGEIGSLLIPGGGAIIGFFGFKAWESVDAWRYSYRSSLGYPDLDK